MPTPDYSELLQRIREAAGDPTGKLMQDELLQRIEAAMSDAFCGPRTLAVRITLDGAHLICRPEEVDMMLDGEEDRSRYTFSDVYLSDEEIDRLPEFEGW